jgi:hypothetical protein
VKAIVKTLIAIVVVLVAVFALVGPGRVVAASEYPFGVGPWSSTGRYCHNVDTLANFVDLWKHSGHVTLSSDQRVTWLALEKTLTTSGPRVPRDGLTAWYRSKGDSSRMTSESALINTWWNQNCTNALMEAPAAVNRVWSGIGSHGTFVHYPRNVVHVQNFYVTR